MKKKNFLSTTFVIVFAVILCCILSGCNSISKRPTTISTVVLYDDVLQKMVVVVPTVGTAILPSDKAFDEAGNEVKVEVGDVIKMEFANIVGIRNITDGKNAFYGFDSTPEKISVSMKNVDVEISEKSYILSLSKTEVEGEIAEGKNIGFFYKEQEKSVYSTIISSVNETNLTINLNESGFNSVVSAINNKAILKIESN